MPLAKIFFVVSSSLLLNQALSEPLQTRVYLDQPLEEIRHDLAGVSIGGQSHAYLNEPLLRAIEGLRIPVARLEAVPGSYPELYDPETGRYDWSRLDQEIENMQKRGVEIVLNLFYMPRWLSPDPDGKRPYFHKPKDADAWGKLVRDIVHHVNIEKGYDIRYWEVWNEPSGIFFQEWGQKDAFWEFYAQTARAVKEADPSAQVGGFGDNAAYPEHLFNFFHYCGKHSVPIDFVSLHWYGLWDRRAWENPSSYFDFARNIDEYYFQTFGRRVPIFWTEWNHRVDTPKPEVERQSAYIAAALYWMQSSPAQKALFFRIEPYKGPKSTETLLDEGYRWQSRYAGRWCGNRRNDYRGS